MKKIKLNDSDYIEVKGSDDKPETSNTDVAHAAEAGFIAGMIFGIGFLSAIAVISNAMKTDKNKEKSK